MKTLASRKTSLNFVTDDRVLDNGRNRAVCVSATPIAAELRLAGQRRRKSIHISWAALYEYARAMTKLAERNRGRAQLAMVVRRERMREAGR